MFKTLDNIYFLLNLVNIGALVCTVFYSKNENEIYIYLATVLLIISITLYCGIFIEKRSLSNALKTAYTYIHGLFILLLACYLVLVFSAKIV
jgi:hypothetical protein